MPEYHCPNCDKKIEDLSAQFSRHCRVNLTKYKKLLDRPRNPVEKFGQKTNALGNWMIKYITVPILILFFLWFLISLLGK